MTRWLFLFLGCGALCACHPRKTAELVSATPSPTASVAAVTSTSPSPAKTVRTWQSEIAEGRLPYRQLTIDDFSVKEPGQGVAPFNVKTFIDPNWQFHVKYYNGFVHAYVKDWIVFSGFDKKESYRRHDFRDIKTSLPYAQALLDLAELHGRQLAAVPNGELPEGRGASFEEAKANLEQKLNAFCQPKYQEAQADMANFAKATHNGEDRKKTRELAAAIRRRLDAQPAPAASPNETPIPSRTSAVSPHL